MTKSNTKARAYLAIYWQSSVCLEHVDHTDQQWRGGLCCESKLTTAAVLSKGESYKCFRATLQAYRVVSV